MGVEVKSGGEGGCNDGCPTGNQVSYREHC